MATRGSELPSSLPPGRYDRPARERRALDDLFSAAYDELRRLASAVRRDDPNATISPTALVNEAWLKLADSPAVAQTRSGARSHRPQSQGTKAARHDRICSRCGQ